MINRNTTLLLIGHGTTVPKYRIWDNRIVVYMGRRMFRGDRYVSDFRANIDWRIV